MKKTLLLAALLLMSFLKPALAQNNIVVPADTASLNIKEFAGSIVKDAPTNYEKAETLLKWLSSNFQWLYTDYQQRTVKEIIVRKGGNCFELAASYMDMIKTLGIKYRPIAEINLHVTSDRRGQSAAERVKAVGNTASVFGRQHNDHRWVEVYDERINDWIPVDPTMALIGYDQWEKARAWFGKRHTINDEFSNDMLAPVAIFVVDPTNKTNMLENRTQYYMAYQLNKLYNNKLEKFAAWPKWKSQLEEFDKHAKAAFAGQENLHNYAGDISALLATYNELKEEYSKLN